MERRSGKYFGVGTALQQISLATDGTLTLKRSGKSRTRQVYPQSVIFWPKLPQTRGNLAPKISKKIFRGDTTEPPQREEATHSRTHLQHGYTPCAWVQAPPLLGPRFRKPFPQINTKNCSLSIVLTATDQKPQKSLKR